ncbi:hypothetical protein [Halobacteriovorax sp. HLS]|uniref:hypothetical protein n=1 Tax=Halobacteriovorax sp. HLS TaxID=2234000 RepID=UPI000FDABD62|nr:hypothetical protein [Halobacteriovorax sp. HLS]
MVLSRIFLTFMVFMNSVCSIELPEISTKQSINNLRFISEDGKFTFYQRRSGSLLLSTNYNTEEVLKGPIGTQYTVTSSKSRKLNLIEQSINFHTYLSVRKTSKIYYSDFGKKNIKYIGEGIDARLHEDDVWISYYSPFKNTLHFSNVVNPSASFKIILQNIKNPYFIPQREMLSSKTILYTDVNKEGKNGLIIFDRANSKSDLLQKSDDVFIQYELCTTQEDIYIGSFSASPETPYSSIAKYSKLDFNLGKGSILYDNNKSDLGHMICDHKKDTIYFIKDLSKEYKKTGYEVAKLDTVTKKVSIESSLKWVNSVLNMDGRLLIPFRGTYYVLEGDKNESTKDNLSKKTQEKVVK